MAGGGVRRGERAQSSAGDMEIPGKSQASADTPNSLAPLLKSTSAGVYKALRPLANAYAKAAGHRQVGLRYDDLISEEQEDVQKVSLHLEMEAAQFLTWLGIGMSAER